MIHLQHEYAMILEEEEKEEEDAMVPYTMPQQRKEDKIERLRGERDQIKFIHLGFERWQVVRFRKARGRQDVP